MKRKLTTQMLNQWRSNIWMIVQLLIVFCAIFYICTGLYRNISNYISPFGYTTDHTYQITLGEIYEGGVGFVENITPEQRVADINTLIERLRSVDGVQTLAYSNWGGPYLANYMGTQFNSISNGDTVMINGNFKRISPEYLEVFDVKSIDGTSQEQLIRLLSEGKLLASKEVVEKSPEGKDLQANPTMLKDYAFQRGEDGPEYHIGAIVQSTKRFDYDNVLPVIYHLYSPEEIKWLPEISVRIKNDCDGREFMKAVRDYSSSYLSANNIYVQNVQPYQSIKEQINARYDKEVIQGIVCVLFLLVNIFLGLFGVFWFRTKQRTSEIALRLSVGATPGSIFRRAISEGLMLLLVSLPFAVFACWWMANHGLSNDRLMNYQGVAKSLETFLISIGFTALVMAIMIVGGVSIPAWKAMRIEPAAALKEE